MSRCYYRVLNLVINGLPSILKGEGIEDKIEYGSFKPCYKWITFNTKGMNAHLFNIACVLNLVINGLPSILRRNQRGRLNLVWSFKPCYKWITFNTLNHQYTF